MQTEAVWHGFADQQTANRRSPPLAMCADGMLLVYAGGLGPSLHAKHEDVGLRARPYSRAASVTTSGTS